MTELTVENLYLAKDEQYFSMERNLLVELVPPNTARVLDIGCGSGVLGKLLKQKRNVAVVDGIEINHDAALLAQKNLDRVITTNVEQWTPDIPSGHYDVMVMGDVIEHLIDPWNSLKKLSVLVRPGGLLVTSVPNVQCWRILFPLIFKGRWTYEEWGLLDRTHLRFFTRKTSSELIEKSGFVIKKVNYDLPLASFSGKLNAITFGLFKDFLTSHHIYCAEKK